MRRTLTLLTTQSRALCSPLLPLVASVLVSFTKSASVLQAPSVVCSWALLPAMIVLCQCARTHVLSLCHCLMVTLKCLAASASSRRIGRGSCKRVAYCWSCLRRVVSNSHVANFCLSKVTFSPSVDFFLYDTLPPARSHALSCAPPLALLACFARWRHCYLPLFPPLKTA